MRSYVVALIAYAALCMSGCFLVGYDGINLPSDSGLLPDIIVNDAAPHPNDSGTHKEDAGDVDAGDVDAGDMDAGDMDAEVDLDGSTDATAEMDANLDAGDAAQNDASIGDAAIDGGRDSGDGDAGPPLADAGSDAGHEEADAGRDAGPPPGDPAPYCGANQQCNLECGDVPVCTPICESDTRCDINCSGADYCKPTCDKSWSNVCEIDCRNTDRCDAKCKGAGDCKIDCRNSGQCNKARCEGNLLQITQCMLVCSPGDPNCGFEYCWGDAYGLITINGLGLTVKQQTCAGNVVTCGGYAVPNANLPCKAK